LRDAEYSPKSFVQTLAAVEGMSEVYPEVLLKLIEDKANGPAVQSMLKNKLPGIVMVEPKGNKKERASAVSPLVEAGNVYLPHPRLFPWVWEYIEQMANFPNAKNDDYVDMTSQALLRFLYAKDKEEEASLSILQKHKRDKMRSLQYKMYRPRGRRR
jgi:predicted phage terminase large subunit-like protein